MIAISNPNKYKDPFRIVQNDIAYLADRGGSCPMQHKATIKMTNTTTGGKWGKLSIHPTGQDIDKA